MSIANEYLNWIFDLQGLAFGALCIMFLVYLWWLGTKFK